MRLRIYLWVTFAVTWTAWWIVAKAVPPASSVFANPVMVSLYALGGLGPTLAAFVAVIATPREGSLSEYGARLLRWRVHPVWYCVTFLTPPLLALSMEYLSIRLSPQGLMVSPLEPLSRIAVLFPIMIAGGGLEEFGWRGIAQPALNDRLGRVLACATIGVIWAAWHLPLFFIHGVPQFGSSFPRFSFDVLSNAFLLGWLYTNTRSVLLCVLYHAAINTSTAAGLVVPDAAPAVLWITECLKFALGFVLVKFAGPKDSLAWIAPHRR
jgi:membrane protease YdiL (CAAX protease family)